MINSRSWTCAPTRSALTWYGRSSTSWTPLGSISLTSKVFLPFTNPLPCPSNLEFSLLLSGPTSSIGGLLRRRRQQDCHHQYFRLHWGELHHVPFLHILSSNHFLHIIGFHLRVINIISPHNVSMPQIHDSEENFLSLWPRLTNSLQYGVILWAHKWLSNM